MFVHTLALAQGGPRIDGTAANVVVMVLVVAAVALVFWASRPSLMARYSTAPRPSPDTPAAPVDPQDPA